MALPEVHRQAAEAALSEARRNPVMSVEQWFRTADVHALLGIEARLEQLVALLAARHELTPSA
jgi:hypothetical protein